MRMQQQIELQSSRHSSSVAGFPEGSAGEGPTCNAGDTEDVRFDPWVGKIPWRKKWQPAPVFLPGGSRGRKSLVAELQTAERLSTQHPEETEAEHEGPTKTDTPCSLTLGKPSL
ncbi:unnamed protein product [Rangifer tarandus platyrhynchus]|uniref:Uncharacterized protein n=2 Tax=Rangifer tarandus platyrhynchus TaxID=3082113 RepID=A0ABN8ZF66_RANTA|nr:unnamed protein product [Rangifer tarandus platyrhynchus]